MREDAIGREYGEYMTIVLVLGIIILVLSIAFLHEGLIAVSIPLLIIPTTCLVSLKINSVELLRRYFLYGLSLSAILEILLFNVFTTIIGKAFSLSISLGILFFLLYYEVRIRLNIRKKYRRNNIEKQDDIARAEC